jgi:hypothetical protein
LRRPCHGPKRGEDRPRASLGGDDPDKQLQHGGPG